MPKKNGYYETLPNENGYDNESYKWWWRSNWLVWKGWWKLGLTKFSTVSEAPFYNSSFVY